MKVKRIEHVGVVVRDVEASRKLWEDCFGIRLDAVEDNPNRPVRLALYPVGESMVELIAGTTPDSRHARMIAEGKGGLNHICFEVENIDEALAELKAKGIPLDQVPRIGHAGCRIAFIDPSPPRTASSNLRSCPRSLPIIVERAGVRRPRLGRHRVALARLAPGRHPVRGLLRLRCARPTGVAATPRSTTCPSARGDEPRQVALLLGPTGD